MLRAISHWESSPSLAEQAFPRHLLQELDTTSLRCPVLALPAPETTPSTQNLRGILLLLSKSGLQKRPHVLHQETSGKVVSDCFSHTGRDKWFSVLQPLAHNQTRSRASLCVTQGLHHISTNRGKPAKIQVAGVLPRNRNPSSLFPLLPMPHISCLKPILNKWQLS